MYYTKMLKEVEIELDGLNEIRVMDWIDTHHDNLWSKTNDRFYEALVEPGDCQSDEDYGAMIQMEIDIYRKTILELIQWYKVNQLEESTRKLLQVG
jgi:hypothetical protein